MTRGEDQRQFTEIDGQTCMFWALYALDEFPKLKAEAEARVDRTYLIDELVHSFKMKLLTRLRACLLIQLVEGAQTRAIQMFAICFPCIKYIHP